MQKILCILLLYSVLGLSTACQADITIDIPYEDIIYKEYDCAMIIPDIQNYVNDERYIRHLDSITDYYLRNTDIITNCFQVGDLTYNNSTPQWNIVRERFFSKFNEYNKPIFCLGNHDYDAKRISNMPRDFNHSNCYCFTSEGFENYTKKILLGKREYIVLVLEFAPRNDVLEWADKVIKENSTTSFIILTHAFLNVEGKLFDTTDPLCSQVDSPKLYFTGGDYVNDSKEIYDKIIYNNDNVEFVFCGHSLTPNYINYLALPKSSGKHTHCIMVNFQHYREGGNGNVGLLYAEDKSFRFRSFCTTTKQFGNFDFSFSLE